MEATRKCQSQLKLSKAYNLNKLFLEIMLQQFDCKERSSHKNKYGIIGIILFVVGCSMQSCHWILLLVAWKLLHLYFSLSLSLSLFHFTWISFSFLFIVSLSFAFKSLLYSSCIIILNAIVIINVIVVHWVHGRENTHSNNQNDSNSQFDQTFWAKYKLDACIRNIPL